MFKFGKAALYERMLREKDRQLDIMAEQVDYLRARLSQLENTTVPLIGNSLSAPVTEGPTLETATAVRDEELDALAMLEAGSITKEQLPDVLEALGLVPELEFESVG